LRVMATCTRAAAILSHCLRNVADPRHMSSSNGRQRAGMSESGGSLSKPPYAALWKSSILRIQLVTLRRRRSPGRTTILETRVGLASYYGREFHGTTTASGVRFDMNALVAAHPSYPFGTRVRVTNLANDRSTIVRIVDRGPAPELRRDGLLIDVSRRAAEVLGFTGQGRTRVRLEVLAWGGR
jgi:peptidoglycan lytic transglycosylase